MTARTALERLAGAAMENVVRATPAARAAEALRPACLLQRRLALSLATELLEQLSATELRFTRRQPSAGVAGVFDTASRDGVAALIMVPATWAAWCVVRSSWANSIRAGSPDDRGERDRLDGFMIKAGVAKPC